MEPLTTFVYETTDVTKVFDSTEVTDVVEISTEEPDFSTEIAISTDESDFSTDDLTTPTMEPLTTFVYETTDVTKVFDSTEVTDVVEISTEEPDFSTEIEISTDEPDFSTDDLTTPTMEPFTTFVYETTDVTEVVDSTEVTNVVEISTEEPDFSTEIAISTNEPDFSTDDLTTPSMEPSTTFVYRTTEVSEEVSDSIEVTEENVISTVEPDFSTEIAISTDEPVVSTEDLTTPSMEPLTTLVYETTDVTEEVSDSTAVTEEDVISTLEPGFSTEIAMSTDEPVVSTEDMTTPTTEPLATLVYETTDVTEEVSDSTAVTEEDVISTLEPGFSTEIAMSTDEPVVSTEDMTTPTTEPLATLVYETTDVTEEVSDSTAVTEEDVISTLEPGFSTEIAMSTDEPVVSTEDMTTPTTEPLATFVYATTEVTDDLPTSTEEPSTAFTTETSTISTSEFPSTTEPGQFSTATTPEDLTTDKTTVAITTEGTTTVRATTEVTTESTTQPATTSMETTTEAGVCDDNPCMNGGACVDEITQYSCNCTGDYKGDRCETLKEGCVWLTRSRSTRRVNCGTIQFDNLQRFGEICDCATGYRLFDVICEDGAIYDYDLFQRQIERLATPSCNDIDECEENSTLCGYQATCNNNAGSFTCDCPMGYELGDNNRDCQDIDECTRQTDNCMENEFCSNTEGAFQCLCVDGYKLVGGECVENRYFPYGVQQGDFDILTSFFSRLFSRIFGFTWWTVTIDTGIPIGYATTYSRITFFSTGAIQFWENSSPRIFQFFNPSIYTYTDQIFFNPSVTVFGAIADVRLGTPRINFQVYDGRTVQSSAFINIRERINDLLGRATISPPAKFSSSAFSDGIDYIIQITWEDIRPFGSASSDETATYQAIIFTNGVHTAALAIYEEGSMNWRAQSKPVPARFGYNIRISRFNLFLSRSASYRPDLLDGSIGLKGVQLFDLDANPSDYINPRAYCLNWYNQARGPLIHQFFHQPCPCSSIPAPFYLFLRSFSFFGFIPFNGCFQPRWPLLGQGYRCTYSWWLRRGYSGFWRSSHFQSVLPFNGRFRLYSDFLRWIENDVLPQYFCCSRSGNQRFCRMYESLRPPSTCRFYRNPFIAWFFGDPHINTLDNRGYTFNGLGEYVMLEYTNGNPFVLQARMGKAFDEKGQELDTGTVFTGFAAGQGGTTLRITLNAERTEMLIQVNESFVDLETLRADGFNSTDDDFSLSFVSDDDGSNSTEDTTTNNNSTSVEASFIYAGQTPTGFTVTFNQGVLDVTMSVAPDYAGEGVTRGLLGVWNDDPSDDFQERDGDTLMPEAGQNLTEREIFEFGQTCKFIALKHVKNVRYYIHKTFWMVSANDSLFDYGNDSWATYNDPNYTPLFLDELLANATDEQRTAAENTCQGDRSCLFDYLAVGPQLGASSMATNALRESEKQGLENFPPEITDIVEVGDTDALMENNTLYVIVGETYTLQVTATDPNNDTVTFSLNGTVPGSAEITDNGTFTWTPMNTTLVAIDIVASDGIVASSETLSVKVCRCENNGTCDFDTDAEGEDFTENKFAVVVCNCTEGWTGTHCEEDEDSCDGDPCFEGVICFDLPPPSTEPDCGPCPPSLTGDGLNCFGNGTSSFF
ncbi:uncharacterized protein [Diadema antillarum]|uniref:uncharacterized protein n=1 Tax=Diadema antillarum TaxID=105358 RepID=UPI003A839A5D